MSAPTRPDHLTRGYSATAALSTRSTSPSASGTSPVDASARSTFGLTGGLGPNGRIVGAPRSGNGSPSHDLGGSSRLFSKRAREIQAQEGISALPLSLWGGPPTSGNSTPLRENIPESPTDGFPGFSHLPNQDSSSQTRRARAGTLPSRFSPGGPSNGLLGIPSAAANSARATPPSQSPFGKSPSPNLEAQDSGAASQPPNSSTLLSRLRAGSLPQRNQYTALPGSSSPFGPSIFSSWNAPGGMTRERGSTLASIASVGSNGPSSPAQSQFSKEGAGENDVHMRTLDYLGLAETPQQPPAQLATPYMPSDYRQSSRFRSYSVNNKDKYADEDDYDDPASMDNSFAAIQNELAATQAAIHSHNLAVRAFMNQTTAGRPRARTAGVLDTPGSRLTGSYVSTGSSLRNSGMADDHGQDDGGYDDLPQAVANLGIGRSNSRNAGLLNPDEPGLEGPTCALWLGSVPTSTTTSTLSEMFKAYGHVVSARVLSHKSCGFVNFERVESAVSARQSLNGKEIFPGAGPIRINFAKPASASTTPGHDGAFASPSPDPFTDGQESVLAVNNTVQGSAVAAPNLPSVGDMTNDVLGIVTQLGASNDDKLRITQSLQNATQFTDYVDEVPPVREPSHTRVHDAPKLRDIRKRIDNQSLSQADIENIALDMLPEIADLAADYLGNTVVQKLFDQCSNEIRDAMLAEIAPRLAEIGCHKNGTWAAQKIIDVCTTPEQMALIVKHIRPYTLGCLWDNFGNYVIQGCLKFGSPYNDFIFEAVVCRFWDVAQNRYGARASRASLESHHATKDQQRMLAAVIAIHSVQLATNSNGALLLTWFLDTCTLPQRRTVLAPRIIPHLVHLCTHKTAFLTVLKVINQKAEPEARDLVLKALFFTPNDQVLEQILRDGTSGTGLIFKVLTTPFFDESIRAQVAENVKNVLRRIEAEPKEGYKRLMDEVGMSTRTSTTGASNGDQRHRPISRQGSSQNGHGRGQSFSQMNAAAGGYEPGFPSRRDGESFPNYNQGMAYNNAAPAMPSAMGVPQMPYQQGMMGRGNPQTGFPYSPVPSAPYVGYGAPGSGPMADPYRQQDMAAGSPGMPNAQLASGAGFVPQYGMGMGGGYGYGGMGYMQQDHGNRRGRR